MTADEHVARPAVEGARPAVIELSPARAALLRAEAQERARADREAMRAVLDACDEVLRERVTDPNADKAQLDAAIADLPVGSVGG